MMTQEINKLCQKSMTEEDIARKIGQLMGEYRDLGREATFWGGVALGRAYELYNRYREHQVMLFMDGLGPEPDAKRWTIAQFQNAYQSGNRWLLQHNMF